MGHNPTSIIILTSRTTVNRENHRKRGEESNEIHKNRDSKESRFDVIL